MSFFFLDLAVVLAEMAMLEDGDKQASLFCDSNEKFEFSLALHDDNPHTLVTWSDNLINQVILLDNVDYSLLDRALSMCLKAESFISGIGSFTMARASAIQGREKSVQKCLKHAFTTNHLPKSATILDDPAFCKFQNCNWFKSFINDLSLHEENSEY